MTRPISLACAFALLSACQTVPATPDAPDLCNASAYAGLVGKPLAAVTLPDGLGARIIRPDTAVTMDYRPDRLNISTDAGGTVVRVHCG